MSNQNLCIQKILLVLSFKILKKKKKKKKKKEEEEKEKILNFGPVQIWY